MMDDHSDITSGIVGIIRRPESTLDDVNYGSARNGINPNNI